jgi:hypothetical protein
MSWDVIKAGGLGAMGQDIGSNYRFRSEGEARTEVKNDLPVAREIISS